MQEAAGTGPGGPESYENFSTSASKDIGDIEVDFDVVQGLLKDLNIYKSGGPDDLHPKLLKTLSANNSFVSAVTKLFSRCSEKGMIPDIWKTARVTALHKKGSKCEARNYRPISLTCILCKLFEKVVRSHLIEHLQDHFHDAQHGFLSGRSCLSNLFYCFDKIDEILAGGEDVDILYLDFQKAFDQVPHKRLLHKLKMYGITGKTLEVISDFLSGRTFHVRVGDAASEFFRVLSGVPQGSVLGPLLFLIYINDIPNGIKSFLLLFADDLKLIVNANLPNITQSDLDILSDWQKKWLLSFNTTDGKCKVLQVSKKGKARQYNEYFLNGTVLPVIESEKDLGVNVMSDLKWDYHISQSLSKAKQCVGWVSRSVISRELSVMLNIYKSLVRPNLEYCVQLWCPVPAHGNWSTIMELESVQRSFTRLIDGIGLLPYRERLQKLKLTTLIERRARGDLIEVFKTFRGKCNYGDQFFNKSRSGYNILLSGDHATKVNAFQTRVVKYWNKLDKSVKRAENVVDFKILLEDYKVTHSEMSGNYWELSEEVFSRINDSNRDSYIYNT